MKLILISLFTLITVSLYSQQEILTCPSSLVFKADSTTVTWKLYTSGTTDWVQIASMTPLPNAKEGSIFESWAPMNVQPLPTNATFLNVVTASQVKVIPTDGEVYMRCFFCIFNKSK